MLILATAGDEKYFSTKVFSTYLNSIQNKSEADRNIVFSVDCPPCKNFNNIESYRLNSQMITSRNSNNCIQHGAFLNADGFSFDDNDVIIFTDGDIVLQRWFSEGEYDFINSVRDNEIMGAYNMTFMNTMEVAMQNVMATEIGIEKARKMFPKSLRECPDFNTGVIVCRGRSWKKLLAFYNKYWVDFQDIIPGFWVQQNLINLIIGNFFEFRHLSYEIHTHTHHMTQAGYGLPEIPQIGDSQAFMRGNKIMFAHRIFGYFNNAPLPEL